MIKMKKVISLFALLCVVSIHAQTAKLTYNVKKGDKYQIDLKMKQNLAPIMSMDLGIVMTTETLSVKDGKIENKSMFDRMYMEMSTQGEKINYDSDKDDEELTEEEKKMKAEIAPAMEMVVYQTMDMSGKILEQKTVPEMKQADQILNQNQITSMVYPKEAVKVGSTWSYTQDMSGMKMKANYKITSITDTAVFADITGSMEGVAEAKIGGKLEIDRASGMPTNVTMSINMGSAAMGMTMDIEMTAKKM